MLTGARIKKIFKVYYGVDFASDMIRCPHDGGACHHNCDKASEPECFRESGGMHLSQPWEGYPINSKDYFNIIVVKRVLDS